MLIFVVKPKDNSEKNNYYFRQGFLLLTVLIAKLVFCAWTRVWGLFFSKAMMVRSALLHFKRGLGFDYVYAV